jgi:hypothetical protein
MEIYMDYVYVNVHVRVLIRDNIHVHEFCHACFKEQLSTLV